MSDYSTENSFAVDQAAKKYQEAHPGVDYETAVKTVLREADTEHAAKKARAMKAYRSEHGDAPSQGWRIYADQSGNIVETEFASGKSLTRLSNIVCGLPKLANGRIDWPTAALVINSSFAYLRPGAAGDFLYAEGRKELQAPNASVSDLESENPTAALTAAALKAAIAKFPEVAAVYNGGRMTETALQTMLWPLFKTPSQYARHDDNVRRYSSEPHVRYDASGNEIHKYVS